MPISNSNKLYQFHIEARPTNSYVYFCETIRTQPLFIGLKNSHTLAPHHSNSTRVRYSNSVDTRVGLHVCALPQRRYGLPHHGAVSRDHYLIHYLFQIISKIHTRNYIVQRVAEDRRQNVCRSSSSSQDQLPNRGRIDPHRTYKRRNTT